VLSDGKKCSEVFDTEHYRRVHKIEKGHRKPKVKKEADENNKKAKEKKGKAKQKKKTHKEKAKKTTTEDTRKSKKKKKRSDLVDDESPGREKKRKLKAGSRVAVYYADRKRPFIGEVLEAKGGHKYLMKWDDGRAKVGEVVELLEENRTDDVSNSDRWNFV
jgi:hypothetical protein